MKSLLVLPILMFFGAAPLGAQQASPTPVVLPKPILASAPNMSKWTVTTISSALRPAKATGTTASASATPTPAPVEKSVYIKTDSIRLIAGAGDTGRQAQHWCVGSMQFLIYPGFPDIGIINSGSPAYIKTDFPGFEWIKDSNFAEMKSYQNQDCWVFKAKVLHAAPGELEQAKSRATENKVPFDESKFYAEKIAYVDSKTQFPVALQVGDEFSVYKFDVPPTAVLSLPDSLKQRIDSTAKSEKAMKAGPPRPF